MNNKISYFSFAKLQEDYGRRFMKFKLRVYIYKIIILYEVYIHIHSILKYRIY